MAVVALSFLLLAIVLSWQARLAQQRRELCHKNAGKLEVALDIWSMEHSPDVLDFWGSLYPAQFEQVVKDNYLPTLPTNPYTGRPMRQLKPGDPDSVGDFRYVPLPIRYHLKDGGTYTEIPAYVALIYVAGPPVDHSPFQPIGGKACVIARDVQGKVTGSLAHVTTERMRRIQQEVVSTEGDNANEALTRMGRPY